MPATRSASSHPLQRILPLLLLIILTTMDIPLANGQTWTVTTCSPTLNSGSTYFKIDSCTQTSTTLTVTQAAGLWLSNSKYNSIVFSDGGVFFSMTGSILSSTGQSLLRISVYAQGFTMSIGSSSGLTLGGSNSNPMITYASSVSGCGLVIDSTTSLVSTSQSLTTIAVASIVHFSSTFRISALTTGTNGVFLYGLSFSLSCSITFIGISTAVTIGSLLATGSSFDADILISSCNIVLTTASVPAISIGSRISASAITITSSTITSTSGDFISVATSYQGSFLSVIGSTLSIVGSLLRVQEEYLSSSSVSITNSAITLVNGAIARQVSTSGIAQLSVSITAVDSTITRTTSSGSLALIAMGYTVSSVSISFLRVNITTDKGVIDFNQPIATNTRLVLSATTCTITGLSFLTTDAIRAGPNVNINECVISLSGGYLLGASAAISNGGSAGTRAFIVTSSSISVGTNSMISIASATPGITFSFVGCTLTQSGAHWFNAATMNGNLLIDSTSIVGSSNIVTIGSTSGSSGLSISVGGSSSLVAGATCITVGNTADTITNVAVTLSASTLVCTNYVVRFSGAAQAGSSVTVTGSSLTSVTSHGIYFSPTASTSSGAYASVASSTITAQLYALFLNNVAQSSVTVADSVITSYHRALYVGNQLDTAQISFSNVRVSLIQATDLSVALVFLGLSDGSTTVSGLELDVKDVSISYRNSYSTTVSSVGVLQCLGTFTSTSFRIKGTAFVAQSYLALPAISLFNGLGCTIASSSIVLEQNSVYSNWSTPQIAAMAALSSGTTITGCSVRISCFSSNASTVPLISLTTNAVVQSTAFTVEQLAWEGPTPSSTTSAVLGLSEAISSSVTVTMMNLFLNVSNVISTTSAASFSSIVVGCSKNFSQTVTVSSFITGLQSVVTISTQCIPGTAVQCGPTPTQSRSTSFSTTAILSSATQTDTSQQSLTVSLTQGGSKSASETWGTSRSSSASLTDDTASFAQSRTLSDSTKRTSSASGSITVQTRSFGRSASFTVSHSRLSASQQRSMTLSRTTSATATSKATQSFTESRSRRSASQQRSITLSRTATPTSSLTNSSVASSTKSASRSVSPSSSLSLTQSRVRSHSWTASCTRGSASAPGSFSKSSSVSSSGLPSSTTTPSGNGDSRSFSASVTASASVTSSPTTSLRVTRATSSSSVSLSLTRMARSLSRSASMTESTSANISFSGVTVSISSTKSLTGLTHVLSLSTIASFSASQSSSKRTVTPQFSASASVTPSPSTSVTFSQSDARPSTTATATRTPSASRSRSGRTVSPSRTRSLSVTVTTSTSGSISTTSTVSHSATTSRSRNSRTRNVSVTASASSTGTRSVTPSHMIPSVSASLSHSATFTVSRNSRSHSPTHSGTEGPRSATYSATASTTTTSSLSQPTRSSLRSASHSASATASASLSQSVSDTFTQSKSGTRDLSRTGSPSTSVTLEPRSSTHTVSQSATFLRSSSRSASVSQPRSSATATEVKTTSFTPTSTESLSLSLTKSFTATPSETKSPSSTHTPSATFSSTPSVSSSASCSRTTSASQSPSKTATPTASLTRSPTVSGSSTRSTSISFFPSLTATWSTSRWDTKSTSASPMPASHTITNLRSPSFSGSRDASSETLSRTMSASASHSLSTSLSVADNSATRNATPTPSRSKTLYWSPIGGIVTNGSLGWAESGLPLTITDDANDAVVSLWIFAVGHDGRAASSQWYREQLVPQIDVRLLAGGSRTVVKPATMQSAQCFYLPCFVVIECAERYDLGDVLEVHVAYPTVNMSLIPLSVLLLQRRVTPSLVSLVVPSALTSWGMTRGLPSAALQYAASVNVSDDDTYLAVNVSSPAVSVLGEYHSDSSNGIRSATPPPSSSSNHTLVLTPKGGFEPSSIHLFTFDATLTLTRISASLARSHLRATPPAGVDVNVSSCPVRVAQSPGVVSSESNVYLWSNTHIVGSQQVRFPLPLQGAVSDDELGCFSAPATYAAAIAAAAKNIAAQSMPLPARVDGCTVVCNATNSTPASRFVVSWVLLMHRYTFSVVGSALVVAEDYLSRVACRWWPLAGGGDGAGAAPLTFSRTASSSATLSEPFLLLARNQTASLSLFDSSNNLSIPTKAVGWQVAVLDAYLAAVADDGASISARLTWPSATLPLPRVRVGVLSGAASDTFFDISLTDLQFSGSSLCNVSTADRARVGLVVTLEVTSQYSGTVVVRPPPLRVAVDSSAFQCNPPQLFATEVPAAIHTATMNSSSRYYFYSIACVNCSHGSTAAIGLGTSSAPASTSWLLATQMLILNQRAVCPILPSQPSVGTSPQNLTAVCPFLLARSATFVLVGNVSSPSDPYSVGNVVVSQSSIPPTIEGVSGCLVDAYPVTGECDIRGGSTLAIVLTAPPSNVVFLVRVRFSYKNSVDVFVACDNATFTSPLQIQCILASGQGRNGTLMLFSTTTPTVTSDPLAQLVGAVSFADTLPCPSSTSDGGDGRVCSGNGDCDFTTGRCRCFTSLPTGYWTGDLCDVCLPEYANSANCDIPCPIGKNGLVCSGSGVCASGICACSTSTSGYDCGTSCPASPSGIACSGNGVCNDASNRCECYADPVRGFWAGERCASCVSGYTGSSCTLTCPTATNSGAVCGGPSRGMCDGTTGEGRCLCLLGYCDVACNRTGFACLTSSCPLNRYGPACQFSCPGLLDGGLTACVGNGLCNDGLGGSGTCACFSGFGGADCSIRCPTHPVDGVCSGHGQCDPATGSCLCFPPFGGTVCQLECPVINGVVCSGHGVCNAGVCSCEPFYTGSACSTTCIDGMPAPCSGRGVCNANGTCTCDSSPVSGFYGGANCGTCAPGYFGPSCLHHCPLGKNGLPCSGHGTCDPIRVVCQCFFTTAAGYWSGNQCDECAAGVFGSACALECPGGRCNPCSGNGKCFDGLTGNGTCQCTQNAAVGYYTADDCSACSPGYYAQTCTQRCPTTNSGVVCGGHGTCSDGPAGVGLCSCVAGYDGGACQVCAAGYYGPSCAPCPSDFPWLVCTGHGTCDAGALGTGKCTCALGYAGTTCGYSCAMDANVTCGIGGVCSASGVCKCTLPALRPGADGTCSVCTNSSQWGQYCNLTCPKCLRGACQRASGLCTCATGYWGPLCSLVCPGGAENPCSGHGVCSPVNGTCSCFRNSTSGFYTGTTCASCDPRYASSNCSVPCPVNNVTGAPCSGRATCWNGACPSCAPLPQEASTLLAACGASCETTGLVCLGLGEGSRTCPVGFWGAACTLLCPGVSSSDANLAATSCSGRGFCNPETGTCSCVLGYGGLDCRSSCPTGPAATSATPAVCSGNGQCVAFSSCVCDSGFYGAVCERECPGGADNPCSGRGSCTKEGFCICDATSYGSSCSLPCPGGFVTPCSLRGTCTSSGTCACVQNPSIGYYGGSDCSTCSGGFTGPNCTVYCDPKFGTASGKVCVCVSSYVGPDCRQRCPISEVDGSLLCSGHGTCVPAALASIAPSSQASTAAVCQCDQNYYDPLCSVHCTVSACQAAGLVHPQCNRATGACECQDDSTGHFAGSSCSDCGTLYWGTLCSLECPCNRHGSCNRDVGTCQCFAGETGGHWSGRDCSTCAPGYVGSDCSTLNTEISSAGADNITVENVAYPARGVVWRDPVTNLLLVGANPLAVFSVRDWDTATQALTFVGSVTLPGLSVASCSVLNDTHLLLRVFSIASTTSLPKTSAVNPFVSTLWVPRHIAHGLLNVSAWSVAGAGGGVSVASTILRRKAAAADTSSSSSLLGALGNTLIAVDPNTNCVAFAVASSNRSASGSATTLVGVQCDYANGTVRSSTDAALFVDGEPVWMEFAGRGRLILSTCDPLTRGNWRITSFEVDLNSAAGAATLHLALRFSVDQSNVGAAPCVAAPGGCSHISGCAASDVLDVVVCGAALPSQNQLVLFALNRTTGEPQSDGNTSFILLDNAINISAWASDDSFGAVLFATIGGYGSSVWRIQIIPRLRLVSLATPVTFVGGSSAVLQMAVNASTRTLYLSIGSATQVGAQAMNLFGLKAVSPAVIDQRGGVTVTFKGEGLIPFPPPVCVFDNDPGSATQGTYVDPNTLLCRATASRVRDIHCDFVEVNLKYLNRTTNVTVISALRPVSAVPRLVVSNATLAPRAWYATASVLLLVADGFVLSATAATCRHENEAGTEIFFTSNVTSFLNGSVALCPQPPRSTPTPPGSVVKYSHDGFVYSATGAPFVIVGAYATIQASYAPSLTLSLNDGDSALSVKQAAATTLLDVVRVATADAAGNQLLDLDAVSRQVRCGLIAPLLAGGSSGSSAATQATGSDLNAAVLLNATLAGVVYFTALVLAAPSVGVRSLYCYDAFDLTKSSSVMFEIVPGTPSLMVLRNPTAPWYGGVLSTNQLAPNPSVQLVDIAGNAISDLSRIPAAVNLTFVNRFPSFAAPGERDVSSSAPVYDVAPQLFTATPRPEGYYEFQGISVRTTFGSPVTLLFSSSAFAVTLRFTLTEERCVAPYYYALTDTFACALCPPHASCDGSTTIMPEAGYWRSNLASAILYPCSPSTACATSMTCSAGYQGAFCAACQPGYGQSGGGGACLPCASNVVNWTVTALLVLAIAALVYVLSIRSVAFSSIADREAEISPAAVQQGNPMSVVVKIVISHLQLLALLPFSDLSMPSWLGQLLAGGSQGTSVSPNLAFVSCATGNDALSQLWTTTYEIPVLFGVLMLIAAATAYLHHRRFTQHALKAIREARAEGTHLLGASPILFEKADDALVDVVMRSTFANDDVDKQSSAPQADLNKTVGGSSVASSNGGSGVYARSVEEETDTFVDVEAALTEVKRSHRQLLDWYDGDEPGGPRDDHYVRRHVVRSKTSDMLDKLFHELSLSNVVVPPIAERLINLFAVSFVVEMFFLYPSIVAMAIEVLNCTPVDVGNGASVRVLVMDATVRCDGDGASAASPYGAIRLLGGMLLVAVGLGIPLLVPLLIAGIGKLTCRGSLEASEDLFFFATGGYRIWFWESVIMMRKSIVAVAVTLSPAGQQQFLTSFWLLLLFFLLNAQVKPWNDTLYSHVEDLSLFTLASSAIMLAQTYTAAVSSDDENLTAMFAAVFSVNVVFLVFAARAFVAAGKKKIAQLAEQNETVKAAVADVKDIAVQARVETLRNERNRLALLLHRSAPRVAALQDVELELHCDVYTVAHALALLESGATLRTAFSEYGAKKIAALLPRRIKDRSFHHLVQEIGDINFEGLIYDDVGRATSNLKMANFVDKKTLSAVTSPFARIASEIALPSAPPWQSPEGLQNSSFGVRRSPEMPLSGSQQPYALPLALQRAGSGVSRLAPGLSGSFGQAAAFAAPVGSGAAAASCEPLTKKQSRWRCHDTPRLIHSLPPGAVDLLNAVDVFDGNSGRLSSHSDSAGVEPRTATYSLDQPGNDADTSPREDRGGESNSSKPSPGPPAPSSLSTKFPVDFDALGSVQFIDEYDLEEDDATANGRSRTRQDHDDPGDADLAAALQSNLGVGDYWMASSSFSPLQRNPAPDVDLLEHISAAERVLMFEGVVDPSRGSIEEASHGDEVFQFAEYGDIDLDDLVAPLRVDGPGACSAITVDIDLDDIELDDLERQRAAAPLSLVENGDVDLSDLPMGVFTPPPPLPASNAYAMGPQALLSVIPGTVMDEFASEPWNSPFVVGVDAVLQYELESDDEDAIRAFGTLNATSTAVGARSSSAQLASPNTALKNLPERIAKRVAHEENMAKKFERSLKNARRAHAVLRALHHVLPRRIAAVENHTDSQAAIRLLLVQNAEALYSAETVLLLSWLRVLRLCKKFGVPILDVEDKPPGRSNNQGEAATTAREGSQEAASTERTTFSRNSGSASTPDLDEECQSVTKATICTHQQQQQRE